MCKESALIRALVIFGVGLGYILCTLPALGQAPAQERPKLKDFGNSLERLKWDAQKHASVETKSRKIKEQKRSQPDEDEDVVRVETSLVVCDVLVLDPKGHAVRGLVREDFVVSEEGQSQEVGTFSLGNDVRVPRSIVLVIDYSGSQFPFIKMSVEAAKTLVDKLSPLDLMAVVTDDVELIADFTADKEKLKQKLDALAKRAAEEEGFLAKAFGQRQRFGRSAQFSALLATLREAFHEADVRPVVIFQTDGDELGYLREPVIQPVVPPNLPPEMHKQAQKAVAQAQKRLRENQREFSLRDIHAAAEKARATIYTVVPGYRLVGLTLDEQLKQSEASRERVMSAWRISPEMRKRLDERYRQTPPEALKNNIEQVTKVQQALIDLASLTGGWADFLEEPAQAADIYERIFSDVSLRYVIGFYPSNKTRDGGRRRVSIEVRGHPEYTVWGRKSYYAPGPDD
jgi:VWFA-related protein